jgi:hypothetical protein
MSNAGKSPSHVHRRSGFSIRRCSFTVAGAAPGLILVATKTRTGFPFHSPSPLVETKNVGKAPDNFRSNASWRKSD